MNDRRSRPSTSSSKADIRAIQENEARLLHLFEKAPVSLWLEDFSEIKKWFDELRNQSVEDLGMYLEEHPEAVIECVGRVRIRDVNEETLKLHRAPSKEALLGSLARTFSAESFDVFREQLISLWSGGTGRDAEAIVRTLDGESRNVLMKIFLDPGRPDWSNAYVAITDITEQKRVEEALRLAEEKLRAIITNSLPVIFMIDREGVFVLSEGKTLSALGLEPGEVVGSSAFELYADYPQIIEGLNIALGGRTHEVTVEVAGVHFEVFYSPCRNGRGEVDGVIGMAVDISPRVEARKERDRLEAQLHQAGKMEAIGNLAGGIAHDFNNLLQAMLGYAGLILDDDTFDERHRADLENIRSAARSASSLTGQLLAFGRRQVIDPMDLDMNEVIAGMSDLVRRLIARNIEFVFVPGEAACTVHADKNQIEQVLVNLSVNARDAMPNGGTLTIRIETVLADDEFCSAHHGAVEGRYVVLSVHDTGQGMDKLTREQMFEPFFTTKVRGKGTGLGLATVYGIVHQHRGMLETFSEIGKGTTVKTYLPFVERPAVRPVSPVADALPSGDGIVLVAEDEPLIRDLIRQMLERAGYHVITASNGEEALVACEERDGRIDMALLDVVMPGLGGYATMERLVARWPKIRFVFSSGYSPDETTLEYLMNEGIPLLQKPFEAGALLAAVRDALAG